MQTIGYLGQDEGRATFITPGMPPPPPKELFLIESLNNFLRQIGGTRRAEAIRIANNPSYTRAQREGYLQRFSGWRYRRYLLLRDRPPRPPTPPPPAIDRQLQMDWMALINRFLGYRRVGLSRIASDATLSLEQKEAHLRGRSRSNYRAYQRQKTGFRRQSAAKRARTIAQWARWATSAAARAARRPPPRARVPAKRPPTASQYRQNLAVLRTATVPNINVIITREMADCRSRKRKYPSTQVRRYIVAAAVSSALDAAGIPRRMAGYPRAKIDQMDRFIETMVLPNVMDLVTTKGCWLTPRGGRNLSVWRYYAKAELRTRKWMDARTAYRPTREKLISIARRGGRFARPDWIYTPTRGRRPAFEIPPEAARAVR